MFSVEYRLAPEAKCPDNIMDFYDALKVAVSTSPDSSESDHNPLCVAVREQQLREVEPGPGADHHQVLSTHLTSSHPRSCSGESGGGYITFGAMVVLAQRDESHLVRPSQL